MDQLKVTELARPEFKANPFPFYARLRAENPVCRTKIFNQPAWLVFRYDDVFTLLKDTRLLKDWRPRTKWLHRLSGSTIGHMLNQDGADHTRLRNLVHKAFTPQMSARMRERIQDICDELLDELTEKGRMDLMSGYALPLPLIIISELLGIPVEDRDRMHNLARSSLSVTTLLSALLSLPNQRSLVRRIRQLIAQRKREPREDLITALAQAEEAGDKLSEKELVATIMLLLIAGYETTVNLIGNGVHALLQHAEQREHLMRDPTVIDSAVEELLRFTSPLDIASQRFASIDMKINSTNIRQGDLVVAMIGSANHDESQFPNPDTLDITREPNKHLSFGQGIHFCIGAPLARLEAQIAFTTLFRRFPHLQLTVEPEALRWRKNLIVRGLEELPVAIG